MPTIPMRESELARPRYRKGGDHIPITRGELRAVRWPAADPDWHPLAKDIYKGAKASGQADWYQQSDIAMLRSLCDDLSYYKNARVRSGQMLQSIMSGLTSLLLTEGDRRRVRIELHEQIEDGPSASDEAIADYRRELGLE